MGFNSGFKGLKYILFLYQLQSVSCFVFNCVHGWTLHFSLSQTFGETRVTNSQDARSDPWEVSAMLVICSRSVDGSINCNETIYCWASRKSNHQLLDFLPEIREADGPTWQSCRLFVSGWRLQRAKKPTSYLNENKTQINFNKIFSCCIQHRKCMYNNNNNNKTATTTAAATITRIKKQEQQEAKETKITITTTTTTTTKHIHIDILFFS